MAKKYKYTEEKVLNEFIGALLTNLISNRKSKTIQSLLKNDPIIRRYDSEIKTITDKMRRDVEKARKTDKTLDATMKRIEKKRALALK
tara:strand:+ start:126 stop:389 length:264 start_codon:yes stop_codon:yes gene_type:complete